MVYDPRSGNTPDAPKLSAFDTLLARLNKSAQAVGKLEEVAQVATNPVKLSAGDLRAATAGDREVATQARRDLQQATLALRDSGGAGGGDASSASTADLLAKQEAARIAEEKRQAGQSAYDLLYTQFAQYGMGALVEPLKQFIQQGMSSAEFTLRLRDTDAYKKRFAANASRIANGLAALSEAEYIGLEDQYQNIMRNYGLPSSYYTRGDMGRQEGFEKFIANDVSAAELEDRIVSAQERVLKSNPQVLQALKQFYPDITNGDILAYSLDPKNALKDIQRKISAAEIGGAALVAGLNAGVSTAEELAGYGVSKAQAMQGFQNVAEIAPRGSQLAEFYGQQPYGQQEATSEVFGTAGAVEAGKRRKKLTALEQAAFAGASGIARGALDRDRANNYGNPIQSGAGYF